MNVPARPSPPDFYPGTNIAHVASVKGRLEDFAVQLAVPLFADHDDLGHFLAVKVVMPNQFPFWLYTYEGTPKDTSEVFFESKLQDWEARLHAVLETLGSSTASVVWKNTDYLRTP
jgi:hypothetical protein